MTKLLTKKDVAVSAGVCLDGVEKWMKMGLRHFRVGNVVRFNEKDIEFFNPTTNNRGGEAMNEINNTDDLLIVLSNADYVCRECQGIIKRILPESPLRDLDRFGNVVQHKLNREGLPDEAPATTERRHLSNRERDALQRFRNDLRAALGSGEGMEHEVRAERQGDERDQRPIGDGEIPGPGSWSHGKGKWGLY